ncbi:MAG: DUF4905 domain-containing protein [Bacteroidota bacterium]
MKLFSLFSQQLRPVWSFNASHTLWRVIFSDDGIVICESRNTETKTAAFSCINSRTGSVLWSDRIYDEQWWIGIEGISDGRLYLHGFRKPDMPEHQGITCIDVMSGNVLWKNNDRSFLTVHHSDVYGYRDLFERRLYYKINRDNGTVEEELQSLPDDVEENRQLEKTDFTFPESLNKETAEPWKLLLTSTGLTDTQIAVVECIAAEKYHVFAVYSRNEAADDGLKNRLYIVDTAAQKKVYSDVLNRSTPYPVPDSFFMDGNRIYYIKERKSLVAVDLPD